MKKLLLTTAALLLATSAVAQQMKATVAADSSSGTYSKMLSEVKSLCNNDELLIEEDTKVKGGAIGNLEALKDNKVHIAFLHSDVIYSAAAADGQYKQFKTLVSLYPEEIHILALRNSKAKTGGYVGGIGSSTKEFNTLTELNGYDVGAAGGGTKTFRLLKGMGDAGFNAISFDTGDQLIAALRAGTIHAAVFVGGAPLPNLEKLQATEFKLLPIGEAIGSRLSTIYRPARISYSNLKAEQIQTLAPMATVVTRQLKTPRFVAMQTKFRQCFYDNLAELQETPGFHPKWQMVNKDDHGVWDWLELK